MALLPIAIQFVRDIDSPAFQLQYHYEGVEQEVEPEKEEENFD